MTDAMEEPAEATTRHADDEADDRPAASDTPERCQGYSRKRCNPLYRTSNQVYGGRRPSVQELPARHHGTSRRFSEEMLRLGMFRENGFNTALDKTRISGPADMTARRDRISLNQYYRHGN